MIEAVIADNETSGIEAIETMLTDLWPELVICGRAASGPEALYIIKKHKPQLAFLEVMEWIDGSAAAGLQTLQTAPTGVSRSPKPPSKFMVAMDISVIPQSGSFCGTSNPHRSGKHVQVSTHCFTSPRPWGSGTAAISSISSRIGDVCVGWMFFQQAGIAAQKLNALYAEARIDTRFPLTDKNIDIP